MDDTLDLVGLAEAAEIIGISTAALTNRRRASGRRPGDWRYSAPVAAVPEPIVELRCGPIWHRRDVVAYREAHDNRPNAGRRSPARPRRSLPRSQPRAAPSRLQKDPPLDRES